MPLVSESGLFAFFRKRPLVSFFILTFVYTWSIWIPLSFLPFDGGFGYLGFLAAWGAYGPGLVAMFVSAILNPEKAESSSRNWLLALLLVWIVAVLVRLTLPEFVNARGAMHTLVLSSFAAGVVFSGVFSGNRGVRELLVSLVRPRGGFVLYVFALVLVPVVFIGVYLGQLAFGLEAQFRLVGTNPLFAVYLWFALVAMKVFHNNMLGEEVGWRGFALPRMQQQFSPLLASLILGAIWAVWHYPLWTMQGMNVQAMLLFSTVVIPLSVIHTWFWNRSGGSIWVVGLLHATCNVCFSLLPQTTLMQLAIFSSIALVMVLIDRMWRSESR